MTGRQPNSLVMSSKKAAKKAVLAAPSHGPRKKAKTNDQTVLSTILADRKNIQAPNLSESDWFEFVTAAEILKDFELSDDEINSGIVGCGADGGIDSIYTFLNSELLSEDTTINNKQRRNSLSLFIIQSKKSANFSEDTLNRLISVTEDLLDLSHNIASFKEEYNEGIRDQIDIFRSAYLALVSTNLDLHVTFIYATQGNQVSTGLNRKATKLKKKVTMLFSNATCDVEFVTAADLLQLIRKAPSHKRPLELSEQPLSTSSGSYICLAPITKYFEFISDKGKLARSIFESNVRDYQDSVPVNSEIRSTLNNPNSDDFWYLNNGVTIITPGASSAGKQITIEDPQIVNGLQTSHEIYEHFITKTPPLKDNRSILVRIILEQDEEARDRIIRATNRQTSIVPVSLRASEQVHRNIEDYLKSHGLYYDRKKNFYKNQGKPISSIITIPSLAQAIMATVLLRADSARARPTTLLNADSDYQTIFNKDINLSTYLRAAEIMRQVDAHLRKLQKADNLERKTITNIRFYVGMVLAVQLVNSQDSIGSKIAQLDPFLIEETGIQKAYEFVLPLYRNQGGDDKAAKGPSLNRAILATLPS